MGKVVSTIRELKVAISDFDDDEGLFTQVIATDGTVGYMAVDIGHLYGDSNKPVITMRHPMLRSLIFDGETPND